MHTRVSRKKADSTESRIVPSENMDEIQKGITGETFPIQILEICDNCHWCATCLNKRGANRHCPLCHMPASQIPMTLDEICLIDKDTERGITLSFTRKLPFR